MRYSWRLFPVYLLVLLVIAVLAMACGAPATRAQQIEPADPRIPTPQRPILVPGVPMGVIVAAHTVDAVVEGRVAQVRVTQVFRNQSGRVAEGVYIFPLPEDAAVSDFQMTVNGEVLEGKLLDRDEARRIYEQIVRSQRDPALLEYLDRGLFQASVFPIPPGETRTVDFSYSQVLAPDGNLLHFNYPLSTERYSTAPVEEVAVTVELRDQPGLRTIYSPNYPITIERTAEDRATAVYTASNDQPAGDFDLYWGVAEEAIGLDLLSYKPAGEDGFFVLLAAPGVETADAVVARDIVVVLDVSGSMRGAKMEQAVAAVRYIVENLNAADRFNLITFSTGVSMWENNLQPADGDATAAALAWLADAQATGSTDINRALLEALAQLDGGDDAESRPAYVLFLTDGQPTQGEQDAAVIVRNATNNLPAGRTPRLFTFGLGFDVNTDLLDTLATDLRGRSQYVRPDEPIDEAVSDFYATVSTPVLADLAVDFGPDVHVEELYPFPLPDLFAGQQVVVAGRYRDGGPVEVTLSGQVNGEERLFVYPNRALAERGGDDFVARLWATRKIGYLLAEIRRSGPQPELVEAVTELSLRYGIVTPYTSYLVLEPNVAMPAGEVILDRQFLDSARVYERGAQVAREMAAAPAAGEAAVEASQARSALQAAETVRDEADQVRYVAGRSFLMRSLVQAPDGQELELWVDQAFTPGMPTTTVEFGSDAYFALLDEPGMAAWLALSPEIIVVTGENEALRVTTGPVK